MGSAGTQTDRMGPKRVSPIFMALPVAMSLVATPVIASLNSSSVMLSLSICGGPTRMIIGLNSAGSTIAKHSKGRSGGLASLTGVKLKQVRRVVMPIRSDGLPDQERQVVMTLPFVAGFVPQGAPPGVPGLPGQTPAQHLPGPSRPPSP